MNKEKQTYVSPETDLFVVRFEQGILTGSPQWGNNFGAGSGMSESAGNTYDM